MVGEKMADTVTISANMFVMTSETPMAQARWKGGVLQQVWLVETFKNGVRVAVEHEWRDVPVVDGDAA